MKKMFLLIVLSVTGGCIAFAGCVINTNTVLHFDAERFAKITRIASVGGVSSQLARAVDKDLDDGIAVNVQKGTMVNLIQLIDDDYAVVKVKGTTCYMLQKHLSCD